MRIISWNVWFNNIARDAEARSKVMPDALDMLDGDVICLNEWSPLIGDLEGELCHRGWEHQERVHTSDSTDPSTTQKNWGLLIASRFPVQLVPVDPPSVAPASWLEVQLPTVGVTLAAARPVTGARTTANRTIFWSWVHDRLAERTEESLIVAGDLNANVRSKRLRVLLAAGWRDTVAESHAPGEPPPSFFGNSASRAGRNDYVLLSPGFTGRLIAADHPVEVDGLRLSGWSRDGPRLSDHAPVVVDLSL
jgi:endonuclease/exonuclease/phosphatase family metal-dependent hydrolase